MLRRLGLTFCFGFLAVFAAWGQSFTASMVGTVTDQSAAVIPGAIVTATHTGTTSAFRFTTDTTGNFSFPQLPPGPYQVRVEAPGFKRYVRSGILLEVNQAVKLDVSLQLGDTAGSVTVTAEAELLESQTAAMGEVVNNLKVQNLPLNGRNPLALLSLTPGANPGGLFGVGTR